MIHIIDGKPYLDQVKELIQEYTNWLGRGHALGDRLIESIMDHAKVSGYKEMVLDTIEPLQAAIHLYKKHGFVECEPYYHNPMDDVVYMRKVLTE